MEKNRKTKSERHFRNNSSHLIISDGLSSSKNYD